MLVPTVDILKEHRDIFQGVTSIVGHSDDSLVNQTESLSLRRTGDIGVRVRAATHGNLVHSLGFNMSESFVRTLMKQVATYTICASGKDH